jgi:hypothetical protein
LIGTVPEIVVAVVGFTGYLVRRFFFYFYFFFFWSETFVASLVWNRPTTSS